MGRSRSLRCAWRLRAGQIRVSQTRAVVLRPYGRRVASIADHAKLLLHLHQRVSDRGCRRHGQVTANRFVMVRIRVAMQIQNEGRNRNAGRLVLFAFAKYRCGQSRANDWPALGRRLDTCECPRFNVGSSSMR